LALNHHFRTDLALEAADTGDGRLPDGVFCREATIGSLKKTTVEIKTDEAAKRLLRPVGTYHTLEGDLSFYDELCEETMKLLSSMLPDGEVLVVGLGNRSMTPDALGPLTADRIMSTAHLPKEGAAKSLYEMFRPVCAICPGTSGQTGMDAADIVSAVVKERKPAAVVAVDALAARSVSRLGTTIQLSDSGISPGAGVANSRRELSRATLGVPVFSLGIPTVIDASTLVCDLGLEPPDTCASMVVSPRDIDRIITNGADILSMALNRALQPSLSEDELRFLLK